LIERKIRGKTWEVCPSLNSIVKKISSRGKLAGKGEKFALATVFNGF